MLRQSLRAYVPFTLRFSLLGQLTTQRAEQVDDPAVLANPYKRGGGNTDDDDGEGPADLSTLPPEKAKALSSLERFCLLSRPVRRRPAAAGDAGSGSGNGGLPRAQNNCAVGSEDTVSRLVAGTVWLSQEACVGVWRCTSAGGVSCLEREAAARRLLVQRLRALDRHSEAHAHCFVHCRGRRARWRKASHHWPGRRPAHRDHHQRAQRLDGQARCQVLQRVFGWARRARQRRDCASLAAAQQARRQGIHARARHWKRGRAGHALPHHGQVPRGQHLEL
jgi:hypothetical protein